MVPGLGPDYRNGRFYGAGPVCPTYSTSLYMHIGGYALTKGALT